MKKTYVSRRQQYSLKSGLPNWESSVPALWVTNSLKHNFKEFIRGPITTLTYNFSFETRHRTKKIKGEAAAAAAAKSLQSGPTLCDPRDGSPPGSPVPGILQARTLDCVAISFSNAWKWKVKVKSLSRVRLLATPWTAAYQAPRSMGFSRQEYWSGVPLPSPRTGIEFIKSVTQSLHHKSKFFYVISQSYHL